MNNIKQKIQRLLRRPDFRRNPIKGLWRRFFWRLRWLVSTKPWVMNLPFGLRIATPKGGAGALIYYQGLSEPETADFITRFLRPGMVFIDIGAHIGEYTLLAGHLVSPSGEVHAFEPNPEIFNLLAQNVTMNDLKTVFLSQCAVSQEDGLVQFEIFAEPSISSLSKPKNRLTQRKPVRSLRVPSICLDTYWFRQKGKGRIVNLLKIDVEGAELQVILGADSLLSLPRTQAPVIIFEYSPANYNEFEYTLSDVLDILCSYGYMICSYSSNGIITSHMDDKYEHPPSGVCNLIAAKDWLWLKSILDETQ